MAPITMRCATCGGDQVMRDAWAVWDDRSEAWILGAVFDAGFCDACGGEVTIQEVELASSSIVITPPEDARNASQKE